MQRKIEQGKRLPDPPAGSKRCGSCSAVKPLAEFYARKSGAQEGKPYAHCISCVKAANIARARARGVQPRGQADPNYGFRKRLARYYNMTIEDYEVMLAGQDGKCPGCGTRACSTGRRFAVDHDHACCPSDISCGKCIRGLLCRSCNLAIGHVRDDVQTLRRLATYLCGTAS
ncbi:endonuclease VII domain-containing protein [Streptomyces sparsogenes]|uniref:endonuclease VII domain-containing protein n=1 Tax=Streptomyces sparsogenes TaxID=67365 RepID=UPI00340E9E2A